jgi:acetylornithine/succinyldiaminopimelate/putrescine aminotransferase
MCRHDAQGETIIDALAGRGSLFGFGFAPIVAAIHAAADQYLGDAAGLDGRPASDPQSDSRFDQPCDPRLAEPLQALLADCTSIDIDSILLSPSADEAIDRALGMVRCRSADKVFRTLCFVGSDHGRTGMCRTASGRPVLSENFGPMMAGFTHLKVGDLDALRNAIDDQTAGVLLSPLDFSEAARPLAADFLCGVRQLCDQHELTLVVDETRIAFGASGQPFTFASIADIKADMVIVSAGLFAGLPGGLIIASQAVTDGRSLESQPYPLQSAVAAATITAMIEHELPAAAGDEMRHWAIDLAQLLAEFEFIRDLHAVGMTIGIETDMAADQIVQLAAREQLRIEAAGETGLRIQPPLRIRPTDREQLFERLRRALQAVSRETAALGV